MNEPMTANFASETLYHYTDAPGLAGILGSPTKNGELWLSQIQYTNDEQEYWHAFDLFKETIYQMRNSGVSFLVAIAEIILPKANHPFADLSNFVRYFSFSVSEAGDLLSQWRGYAPHGGYSIAFDRLHLGLLAKDNEFELITCIYDDKQKQQIIDGIVTAVQDVHNSIYHGVPEPGAELSPEDRWHHKAAFILRQVFARFAVFFKHSSFQEEKEWRVIGVVPAAGEDPRARWRTRGDLILPYCSLDIGAKATPLIKGVVVGPGVNFKLATHSIRFMRYGEPFDITQSKVPLRR